MPQIVAVFLTAFWISMALFGLAEWYWALAGWFLTGAAIDWAFRRRAAGKGLG